jgi:hypothetical protein
MRLTLVIPGLLWSPGAQDHPADAVPLPALAALLGRSTCLRSDVSDLHEWLVRRFRLGDSPVGWAALRMAGDGIDPGEASWMCADPVHLRLMRDCIVLADDRTLAVSDEEARALIEALNAEFADRGVFLAGAPARWYLRWAGEPPARTHPVSRAVGRRIDSLLPAGDGSLACRRLMNDAQVMLHHHPVNAAREADGRPAINSIWLWGAGAMPRSIAPVGARVFADDPLVRGLASLAGANAESSPPDAHALPWSSGGEVLAVLDALSGAAAYEDAAAWADALAGLERTWFSPILRQYRAGRAERIEIVAPGDSCGMEAACASSDRWKLWRRPVGLAQLSASLAAS